ncbi:MAG: succinate dehydrogenase iron-sulfur subunit [Chloroflexota bacterium]|nr:succinate dehydrogenase iron-sulfur subunit [Chloroflexota bacterium]
MTESKNVTVRVQRFNPDTDRKPYLDSFEVELTADKTVLDALHEIKTRQDGSVTYRRSCRHAICGSCAMNINGVNMLACNKPLRDVLDRKGQVTIRPLPYLPIIKDLVVDRTVFWEQYVRVKPWLEPPEIETDKEYRVSPAEVAALDHAETCIMCGACYSACTVVAGNKRYIGPHALLKAYLRVVDPRDTAVEARLQEISGYDGVYRCHTIFNCIDACPKHLSPTSAIERLRKMAPKSKRLAQERQERQRTLTQPVAE